MAEVDFLLCPNLFQYRRWLIDQLLLGFAHIVYTVKGKRFTSECWIVSRFSVRWSSTSTILTLMAWRSNIPQEVFPLVRDCLSLLKNDLYFTCKWQSLQLAVASCAFCALFMCYQKCLNFALLKVLPSGCGGCCQSFGAEASS